MKKLLLGILAAILLFGMALSSIFYTAPATASPALIPTPVAGYVGGTGSWASATWYNATPITADAFVCQPNGPYGRLDLHWWVDQGGASNNSTDTLTLYYTHDKTISKALMEVGPTVVTSNTADAGDMQQFAAFSLFTCVDINVTGSQDVTWTVKARQW